MIKIVKVKSIVRIVFIITIIVIIGLILKRTIKKPSIIQVSNISNNKYKILVDVEESRLYLFENDILIKTYKCSGGKPSTPSPIGTWKIVSKAKWGEGFRTVVLWD